jgi:hypothetical protein
MPASVLSLSAPWSVPGRSFSVPNSGNVRASAAMYASAVATTGDGAVPATAVATTARLQARLHWNAHLVRASQLPRVRAGFFMAVRLHCPARRAV